MNYKIEERLNYILNTTLKLACYTVMMLALIVVGFGALYMVINMVEVGPSIMFAKP